MAFERMMDDQDDPAAKLRQQLEGQMQTQPVGAPSALGAPASPAPMGAAHPPDTGAPASPAPKPALAPAPTAGAGGLAQYGTGDIDAAKGLRMGDYANQLEGFSGVSRRAAGERGGNTIKNSAGDIFSRYDVKQAGAVDRVMADEDFRRLHPNAVKIDHPNGDQIDFDGPGPDRPVDVIRGARAGGAGEAWQWGVDDGSGPAQGAAGGSGLNQMVLGGGGDPIAAIQAQLGAISGNGAQDEQTLIQQLLAQQGL